MLKKTMTYTDYNGTERTEDFYFNLTKAELIEMGLSENGGLDALIDKIISEKNQKEIIKLFKEIILKAYGEKSLDGKHFVKSEEISTAFSQTEAFSDLFMELAFDAKAGADFINALIPSNIAQDIAKYAKTEETVVSKQ